MTEVEYFIDARYSKLKVIGSGSFGVVASAIDSTTGQRVAIKKILSAFSTTRSARHVLREVRLLHHLKHRHIVQLLDIDVPAQYRSWDDVYIVTPLLRTDLRSALNDGLLSTPVDQKRVAFQLLLALDHMHSHDLMHRDVKTRNVLLNHDLSSAQLCDLGHSRFYHNCNIDDKPGPSSSASTCSSTSSSPVQSQLQPPCTVENTFYRAFNGEGNVHEDMLDQPPLSPAASMTGAPTASSDDIDQTEHPDLTSAVTTMIQSAPEISLSPEYDSKVDIWAAGCVIADIVHPSATLFDHTGRRSHMHEILEVVGFPTEDDMRQLPDYSTWFMKLKKQKQSAQGPTLRQRLGPDVDPEALDLITNMLRFNPHQRPSAQQAMNHPWFDEVRAELTFAEEDERYNFAKSEPTRKASRAQLKDLVWKEVVAFHPEAPNLGVH